MKELIVLEEDRQFAMQRIAELEREILELGPEFYEAFNQSSETWHDNAPFDALRERQALLDAERQQLRRILQRATGRLPKIVPGTAGIGSYIELESGARYFIAGDWTPRASQQDNGYTIISAASPLGAALIGKRIGDMVVAGKVRSAISRVGQSSSL